MGGEEGDKDIYCQKCCNEETLHLTKRPRSRSKSRVFGEEDHSIDIVEVSISDIRAQAMVETTTIMAEEGDVNKCPRCNGKVFEAERMASSKNVFHKKCFNCLDCHRSLDSSLVNEGPDVSYFPCLFLKRKHLLIFSTFRMAVFFAPIAIQRDMVLPF